MHHSSVKTNPSSVKTCKYQTPAITDAFDSYSVSPCIVWAVVELTVASSITLITIAHKLQFNVYGTTIIYQLTVTTGKILRHVIDDAVIFRELTNLILRLLTRHFGVIDSKFKLMIFCSLVFADFCAALPMFAATEKPAVWQWKKNPYREPISDRCEWFLFVACWCLSPICYCFRFIH